MATAAPTSHPASSDVAPSTRGVVTAAVLDVISILAFVTIGRRNHQEGVTVAGVVETAAPFLLALAVAWVAARAWRRPASVGTGLVIWAVVMVVGMGLRHWVFGSGIALSFMMVAGAFLAVTLIGRRAVAPLVAGAARR